MFLPWAFVLLSFRSPSIHLRDNEKNIFITPPGPGPSIIYDGNPVWALNSSQRISWITNVTSYRIELWQQSQELPFAYSISTVYGWPDLFAAREEWSLMQNVDTAIAGTGAGLRSTFWNVQLYTSNLTFSPIYFFWLSPNAPDGITSHYFNISAEIESDLPSGSETISAASSTVAVTSATGAAETTNTTTATNGTDIQSAASVSPTLRIGIGLGVGLGVPFLLITGAFIGLRMRKSRRPPAGGAALTDPTTAHHLPQYVEQTPVTQVDDRGKPASIYQLSDHENPPQLSSRAELG